MGPIVQFLSNKRSWVSSFFYEKRRFCFARNSSQKHSGSNCAIQKSEECQKPQPPLLLKKVSQYTSHLYCNTPPICTAVLLVPLRSEEREILSVLLPFVSQYASHLYCNTPPICIAILLGKSWWLWSPECSPCLASMISRKRQLQNNNARGIKIQLHAHQLHNNNRWGINCAVIPAPGVLMSYH